MDQSDDQPAAKYGPIQSKAQHQPPASHPGIRFAPTESGQHGRNQKNLLGVKTIRFLHHSTKHAAKHDTTSNILLCVFLFLLVCVHYHYHNEIGASLIGRKISPRYVSFWHLGAHSHGLDFLFPRHSSVWRSVYCVCCWVSPILKTDPSLSVNQASAKIKDKLFLAGLEYKSWVGI